MFRKDNIAIFIAIVSILFSVFFGVIKTSNEFAIAQERIMVLKERISDAENKIKEVIGKQEDTNKNINSSLKEIVVDIAVIKQVLKQAYPELYVRNGGK